MDDDSYSLSYEGARMMAIILLNASDMGLFQKSLLSEANITEYVNTLAKTDILWREFDLPNLEERKVMLAMALMSLLEDMKNLN